jgi:hypothetical protein
MRCGMPRTDEMQAAMNAVINAARRFSDCAAEFDGDLSCCGECIDALWTAVDRMKKAEEAP